MNHTSKKPHAHVATVANPPAETPSEALARAAAIYDATRESPAQSLAEVADTLDDKDGAILRAIGLLRCSSLNGDIDPDLVDAAIEILADVRETIRICVRGELTRAGVFVAETTAVTS